MSNASYVYIFLLQLQDSKVGLNNDDTPLPSFSVVPSSAYFHLCSWWDLCSTLGVVGFICS